MPSLRVPSSPLDEDLLDDIAARAAAAPEPLAALGSWVAVARDEGDPTGVRKRLFELAMGVVRYGVAVGLGGVQHELEGATAPKPLAQLLQTAVRLSDGSWCQLGRTILDVLLRFRAPLALRLAWLKAPALREIVHARNRFVHDGGTGDDAPEHCLAVLRAAASLLETPLMLVTPGESARVEQRSGTPLRPGIWRRYRGPVPQDVRDGAYLGLEDQWLGVTPWVPLVEGRLVLPDAPHAARKPWRSFDPDLGEHHTYAPLDDAIRALAGADPHAPQPMTDRPPLVGRQAALECIRQAAEQAARGAVRVVLFTGPFGIGGTRLLREAAEALPSFGFRHVLEGGCSPERRSLLHPLRAATRGRLPAVEHAINGLLQGDAALRGTAPYEAALEAVEAALLAAGHDCAIALTLDDLQWADEATLQLLRLIVDRAQRNGRGRVCIVGAIRDDPDHPPALTSLVGDVVKHVGSETVRVALSRLTESEAEAVLDGVGPVEPRLAARVRAGAAGVPFFLVQPLLAWEASGALAWRDQRWCAASPALWERPVPGVGDLVRARLDSFFDPGGDARRAAEVLLVLVAMTGSGLSTRHVETAAARLDISTRTAEIVLRVLTEAGLLVARSGPHQYGLDQGTVRDTILSEAKSLPWVPRAHRVLLETLEPDADPAVDGSFLAEGFLELGDTERAMEWWRAAIRRLLYLGACHTVLPLADRLAEIGGTRRQRLEARLFTAEALHHLGRHREADAQLAASTSLAVGDPAGSVRLRLLRLEIAAEIGGEERGLAQGVVGLADRLGDLALGVEARLTIADLRRSRGGLALLENAERRLPRVPAAELPALAYRLYALRAALLYEARRASDQWRRAALQAREAAEATGSALARLVSTSDLAVVTGEAGDLEAALQLLDDVVSKARAHHFGSVERTAASNRVGCLLRLQRFEEAITAATTTAASCREAGNWRQEAAVLSQQASAYLHLQQPERALTAIDRSLELKRSFGDVRLAFTLSRRAEVYCQLGRADAARADAEEALQVAQIDTDRDRARAVLQELDLDRAPSSQ